MIHIIRSTRRASIRMYLGIEEHYEVRYVQHVNRKGEVVGIGGLYMVPYRKSDQDGMRARIRANCMKKYFDEIGETSKGDRNE